MSGHVLGGVKNIFLYQAKYFHPLTIPARLAQSVEHETLNLRVVGSSPTLGVLFYKDESLEKHFDKNAATRDRTGDL